VARQDSDFLRYAATVSTVAGQTALAPGALIDHWVEDDRAYFRYGIDVPVRHFFSFLSAAYEVVRDRWNDVTIEIFHHGPHDANLERMLEAARDSLAYYSTEFGPYPYRTLRIVEFPAYRSFAQAYPGMIPFSESMGFVADVKAGDIDMPYYVTAHEIAHQWWGHQVAAANVEGDGLIHESLAQYAALLVMERRYGKERMRRFLKYELDRYLSERAADPEGEKPLFRVGDQPYIYYRKGSLAMYAMRDYLGTEVVNRALARLVELRGFSAPPYATSLDLVHLIKEETGPESRSLVEDFLEKITLHDLSLNNATFEPLPDGRYRVRLTVAAEKRHADPDGTERPAPFDLPVDIGLFRRSPAHPDFGEDDVIYLARHVLPGPGHAIELIVDHEPAYAGIDPYSKLIDRDPEDNLGKVVELADSWTEGRSRRARSAR
jgi:hypothetical protein